MAEPGLLARRRAGGDALSRSRWGGSDGALAAAFVGPDRLLAAADWQPAGRAPRREWVPAVDCLRTAAVYVLDDRMRVYLPLWAGLPTAGLEADPQDGALVRVRSLADARALRRGWRRLKGALAGAVRAGECPPAAAPFVLAGALAGREVLAAGSNGLL